MTSSFNKMINNMKMLHRSKKRFSKKVFDYYDYDDPLSKGSDHTSSTAPEEDEDIIDDDDISCSSSATRPLQVQFHTMVTLILIDSHDTYTEEEKVDCWYTKEEQKQIKSRNFKVAKMIDDGKPEKASRPYRGLEHCCDQGGLDFEAQVSKTIDAVMDEQDQQWLDNVTDESRIAALSQKATASSITKALHLAKVDEVEAFLIHNEW